MPHRFVRVPRGSAIVIDTTTLVQKLADRAEKQQEFIDICNGLKTELAKMGEKSLDRLLELHRAHFHPTNASNRLTNPQRDLEKEFIRCFDTVMKRSNFEQITEKEWNEAKYSRYLLRFKIRYNKSKLDDKLLEDTVGTNKLFENRFLVYHRGIGIDNSAGFFFSLKLSVLSYSLWKSLRGLWCKSRSNTSSPLESAETDLEEGEDLGEHIQRIHIEDIKIKNFFQRVQLQEPTYKQVVVLYRLKNQAYEYGIHLRQFREIPMADLEIVVPEKTTPRLGKSEWIKLFVSALAAGAFGKASLKLGFAILAVIFSYSFKVYYTFQSNVLEFGKLVSNEVYDKQRDTGPATLLCLREDFYEQEANEAIVAYFALLKQGRSAKPDELKRQCESVLKDEFKVSCEFDLEDAIRKLAELGIATGGESIECRGEDEALEVLARRI